MDLTGKQLGKYKLTERLGRGGMAEVYKAFQSGVERDVAVKVMHGHLADSADFRQRFQREAKAIGQLQHPHIVRVIDFDIQDDNYYMVMEFVQGGDLRGYLDQAGALPVVEALSLTQQLASALSYAHHSGMIHRDIKPANIMFADEGRTQTILTDFGVARLLDEVQMTMSGTSLGTPSYMAPEVVTGDGADQRSDVFSLGVVLYEMLTGRTPHKGDTPYAVMLKQANEPLPPPTQFQPTLSPAVETVVMKAVAREPDDRYATAEEFLTAIQSLDEADNVKPLKAVPPPKKKKAAVATATKNKWLPLAGAIAGVLLIGMITLFLLTRTDSEPEPTFLADVTPTQAEVAAVATATAAIIEETATTIPTLAPTPVPTDPPTVEPSPVPTIEPTPVTVEADPTPEPVDIEALPLIFDDIRFIDSDAGNAFICDIELERVRLPDAGTNYVVWLGEGNALQSLGVLPLEGNVGRLSADLGISAIDAFDRLVISMEPEDAALDTVSGDIVFDSELSAELINPLRQMLVNDLVDADIQLDIALRHAGFMQDALNADDLAEALNHAEHVINILDGVTGDNFGDFNGDNQAQNPGDDVGVRVYLAQAQTGADEAFAQSTALFAQTHAENSVAAIGNASQLQDEAQDLALKLFAMDSIDELQPFADQLLETLNQVRVGNDLDEDGVVEPLVSEGGISAAYEEGLVWAARSYVPDELSESADSWLAGTLHFADNDTAQSGTLTLELNAVPQPPEGTHYYGWLRSSDRGEDINLGILPVENNRIQFTLTGDQPHLNLFDQLLITLETEADVVEPSNDIVYAGGLSEETHAAVDDWLFTDGGLLPLAIDQAAIALDHWTLLHDELNADNLNGARRHAEHIINVLDGETGDLFGDLDGNGAAENPGDGMGVRSYMTQIVALSELVDTETVEKVFYIVMADAAFAQATGAVDPAIDLAMKVLASDSAGEALGFSADLQTALNQLLDGQDVNENGIIDPLDQEGGLTAAYDLILAYAHFPIEGE